MNKSKNLSDTILIEKYQKGDLTVLNLLVKKWHLKFCDLAFWIVKDADVAKDIAQESWTVIINKLSDLNEPKQFKSWAISIVNRKAIDWIRANNRERNKLIEHFNESEKQDTFSAREERVFVKKALLKSIEKLSTEHQMVIRLFYKENYTLKEISEIIGVSIGTTKSRLFHAREKIKNSLNK